MLWESIVTRARKYNGSMLQQLSVAEENVYTVTYTCCCKRLSQARTSSGWEMDPR